MTCLNKVSMIGHLGRDPDIRRLNSGDPVANFSIALSETWRDKTTGDRKERTEWVNVVIFNEGIVRVVEQYAKKGSKLYVEGKLQTREYKDKDGVQRKTTEVVLSNFDGKIVLLDGRPDRDDSRDNRRDDRRDDKRPDDRKRESDRSPANSFRDRPPIDDDIPF